MKSNSRNFVRHTVVRFTVVKQEDIGRKGVGGRRGEMVRERERVKEEGENV